MENCVINATGSDTFCLDSNISLNANNCVFTNSDINTSINDDSSENKLVLKNSVFKNSDLYLSFSDKENKDTGCTMSLCEISGKFSAKNLSKMERTVASGNVFLGNTSEIKDCYLKDCTLSYTKPTVIENYNSNANDEMSVSHREDSLSYTPL